MTEIPELIPIIRSLRSIETEQLRRRGNPQMSEGVKSPLKKLDYLSDPVFIAAKCEPKPLSDPEFCEPINRVRKKFRSQGPPTIQPAVWGALSRNRNVLCICPEWIKRASAFVPMVADALLKRQSKERTEPLVLLVVPYSIDLRRVVDLFGKYIGSITPNPFEIVELYGNGGKEKTCIRLLNGCALVVATPPALCRMLKESADVPTSFYISLNQLIWVVFDFMEVLLEFFDPEVKEIYSLLVKSLHQYPRSLTFAVFGSSWTAAVENFYRQFQMFDPVLILHPWMTTVPLFGDSIIKAVMCSSRDLLTEFLKTLKKEDVKKKIKNRRSVLVCCTDDISADVLWKTFHSKQMNEFEFGLILAINSCSRETELLDARKKWSTHNNYSGKVFIVVDCRLPELHINDVEVLIHFKLPRVSLNAQGIMDLRFSSLKTVIKAIAERKINTSLDPDGKPLIKMEFNRPLPKAFIILFVTESDAQISEEIRDFLTETRKVVPREILEMAGARRCEMINSGVKREMAMLCPNLKRLGFCPNSGDGSNVVQLNSCGFRHYVTLSDEPVCGIPTSGDVFVRVTSCFEANRFHGVPVKHFSVEGGPQDRLAQLNNELSKEFISLKDQTVIADLGVGDYGIVQLPPENHSSRIHRFAVLSVLVEVDSKWGRMYLAELVDEGIVIKIAADQCRPLEKRLWPVGATCQFPPMAVEIVLSNVKPLDKDPDWPPLTNDIVAKRLLGRIIRCRVLLALERTIWAERVVITDDRLLDNLLDVGRFLVAEQLASRNEKRLTCNEAMRKRFGLPNPSAMNTKFLPQHSTEINKNYPVPSMAFLTVRDSCEIRISAVEDIRLFYVQQNSFSDRLDRLMVEMHRAISDFGDKETRWCELGIEEVFEGLFCAVKVNEEWLRGRVESLVPMQSDHLIVVFCVDFGDYVHLNISGSSPQPSKFLRRIDRKFIERLPFQAIPCVFHNRKTLIDRMDEKACQHRGDLLWDISRDLLLRPYSLFAFTSAKLKKKSGVVVYVVSVFFRGEDVFDKVFYAGNNPSVESIDHQKYVLSGDDCQNNLMKLLSRIKFNHFEELGNTQVEFLINVLYSESSGSFENFSLACQCLELIVRSKRLKSVNVCQIWSEDPPPPVRWYLAGNYQVRIHEFPGYIYHYTGLLLATLNLLVVCPAEVARNILVRHSLISAISIIAILSEDNIDCEPTTINICKIISLSCKIFDNQSLADFWIESDICWDHCFHLNQLDILAKLCNLLNLGTSDEIRTCAVVAIEALCSRTPWMLFIPTVEYNIVGSILSLLAQAESLASVEPMLWLLTSVLAQKDFCLDADISSTFSCLRAASSNVQNLIADNQEDFETLAESLNKCETAFNRILRAELTRLRDTENNPGDRLREIQRRRKEEIPDDSQSEDSSVLGNLQESLPRLQHKSSSIQLRTPEVCWFQTEDLLKFKVILTDISNPTVASSITSVAFWTCVKDQFYTFEMELYRKIVSESICVSHQSGAALELSFHKVDRGLWKRLTKSRRKPYFLKLNFDAIVTDEIDDIGIFESQIGMNLLPLSADSESDECLTDEETQNCSESEENEIY